MRSNRAGVAERAGARRPLRQGVVILKLGGSHARSAHLPEWLGAIAAEAGSIVIVPGGGPFADAVRDTQAEMGFDNAAAHEMALMAMAQFGRALQSLNPALRLVASLSAIRRALNEGMAPVWAPDRMVRAANLPESWELTSDSLAAWLADAMGAQRLILLKHGRFACDRLEVFDLVEAGVVDPLFPRFIKDRGFRVSVAAPADSARLSEELRGGVFPEILQTKEAIRNRAPAAE